MCDGPRSGGGRGRLGPPAGIPVVLALLAALAACGPRADQNVGGGVNLGAKPTLFDRFSHIDDPAWTIDGDQVTFPVPFHVQAQDTDANMRFVDITVFYVNPCDNSDQEVDLLYDLDPSDWARTDIIVDGETIDEVRVPTACYPDQNLFNVQLRVRDARGNLSNTLVNAVQVGAGQGTGGGTP